MKKNFKQDINFLENPLWFQDERMAARSKEGYVWQDKEGYVYRAGFSPPVKTDMVFLMYLLLISQRNGWAEKLYLSRYEIMKGCGLNTNQYWYKRLEDGLNRWLSVTVHFQGTFYNGNTYETLNFGIIDDWGLNENTGKLEIRLNEKWLDYVRKSVFFKFLDFEIIKNLGSATQVMLNFVHNLLSVHCLPCGKNMSVIYLTLHTNIKGVKKRIVLPVSLKI